MEPERRVEGGPVATATMRPGRDALIALGLGLLALALYTLSFQTRFFGDGPGLFTLHVLAERPFHVHVLYLPACDLLQRLLPGVDPLRVPELLSSLPAALGLGLGYLFLRRVGAEVFGALVAIGLFALSPALWFFATTVELHALVFGTVAFVAWLTVSAPWSRPALALGLVAAAFPLLFWAHESTFTLGLGWVFLVQFARSRQGTTYSWRGLLLGVGPVLLFALLLGLGVALWLRFGSLAPLAAELERELAVPTRYDPDQFLPVWRDELLLPLGLLLPLALAGWRRVAGVPHLALATLVATLVPMAFFLWWDVYENGGYVLGSAPFLLVPVAFLLGRASRTRLVVAALLLTAQGTFAYRRIAAYDQGWDPAERVTQTRAALGDSGLLLVSVDLVPDIRCWLPGIESFSLASFVRTTLENEGHDAPPGRALELLRPFLERRLERYERVAVELGYPRVTRHDSPSLARIRPSLAAIEAYLRARYVVRELPHPFWPMLVLDPKSSAPEAQGAQD